MKVLLCLFFLVVAVAGESWLTTIHQGDKRRTLSEQTRAMEDIVSELKILNQNIGSLVGFLKMQHQTNKEQQME